MNKSYFFILLIIIITAGTIWYSYEDDASGPDNINQIQSGVEHSIDGISFSFPEGFALALHSYQILVDSFIPPCEGSFDYCIYYTGQKYEGTNFDSAGLRIQEREDLTSEDECLSTPPEGYSNEPSEISEQDDYSTSVFISLGDSGAGHYSISDYHRLWFDNLCYEFETRIGGSQFENYEEGEIEEFTEEDREELSQRLDQILYNIDFTDESRNLILN